MTSSTSLSSIILNTKAKLRYFVLLRKTHSSTWRPSPTPSSIGTQHVVNPPRPPRFTFSLNLLVFSAWMTSSQWEQTASMPQITRPSPIWSFTSWFPCWVCRGAPWSTTVQRKWGWQLAALCLQTGSTYRLTEGYVSFRKGVPFLVPVRQRKGKCVMLFLQAHLYRRHHGPWHRCVWETRRGTVTLSQGNEVFFLKQKKYPSHFTFRELYLHYTST